MILYFVLLFSLSAVFFGAAWLGGQAVIVGLSMYAQAACLTVGGIAIIAMVLLLAAMQMFEDYQNRVKNKPQDD